MIIGGRTAIKAILEAGKRRIAHLWFCSQKYHRDLAYVLRLARQQGVPVTQVPLEAWEYSEKIVGEVPPREYESFDWSEDFGACLVGVEDPYNLGQSLRTLYAMGCRNVLLDRPHLHQYEEILLRASGGASEFVTLSYLAEVSISALQDSYQLVAASRESQIEVGEWEFHPRTIIFIGGEKRGINATLQKAMHHLVYIGYGSSFKKALGTVAACSIMAYCYRRGRS